MAATRRNFNLSAERAALIRSLKNAETNWYAMCRDFRDVGQCWLNIKAELQERGISAGQWASENAPISKRWLDKYAEFTARWNGTSSRYAGSGRSARVMHRNGAPACGAVSI